MQANAYKRGRKAMSMLKKINDYEYKVGAGKVENAIAEAIQIATTEGHSITFKCSGILMAVDETSNPDFVLKMYLCAVGIICRK